MKFTQGLLPIICYKLAEKHVIGICLISEKQLVRNVHNNGQSSLQK